MTTSRRGQDPASNDEEHDGERHGKHPDADESEPFHPSLRRSSNANWCSESVAECHLRWPSLYPDFYAGFGLLAPAAFPRIVGR